MNRLIKEQIARHGQNTICHELGHVIGYCLSFSQSNTNLGNILHVRIGSSINEVVPLNNSFHVAQINENEDLERKIRENITKKELVIAWFIEVLLGCTFQSLYEKKDFEKCFDEKGLGKKDLENINDFLEFSELKVDIKFLLAIQKDLVQIIEYYKIIESLDPLIEEIVEDLIESNTVQLIFKSDNLDLLIEKLNRIISTEFLGDYIKIVNKYSIKL